MKLGKVTVDQQEYYIIQIGDVKRWIVPLLVLVLIFFYAFHSFEKLKEKQALFYNKYENLQSSLWDKSKCYLCGEDNYYKSMDNRGVISLNDWYVIDMGLKFYDEMGNCVENYQYQDIYSGNTGEVFYMSRCNPSGGEGTVEVSLPEKYELNTEEIEKHLCQKCLDKVAKTFETFKLGKNKKLLPICLVDFKTLEIYALQEWNTQYIIRDYVVDIAYNDRIIMVDAKGK